MDQAQINQLIQALGTAQEDPVKRILRDCRRAHGRPELNATTQWSTFKERWKLFRSRTELDAVDAAGKAIVPADKQAYELLACATDSIVQRLRCVGDTSVAWNTTIVGGAGPDDQNARFEAWFAHVEGVFQPAVESRMARTDFEARVQLPREDVQTYFNAKWTLWQVAYGADSEKHHMDTLKDHIIKGLINTVVKRQIRKRETATAEQLRQALIEEAASERQCFMDGTSESTTLDGLTPTTSSGLPGFSGQEEPMHIGAFSDRQCYNCQAFGHLAYQCTARGRGGAGYRGRGGRGARGRGRNNPAHANKDCNHCGIRGHIAADCRKKQRELANRGRGGQDAPRGGRGYRGAQGGRGGSIRQMDGDAGFQNEETPDNQGPTFLGLNGEADQRE